MAEEKQGKEEINIKKNHCNNTNNTSDNNQNISINNQEIGFQSSSSSQGLDNTQKATLIVSSSQVGAHKNTINNQNPTMLSPTSNSSDTSSSFHSGTNSTGTAGTLQTTGSSGITSQMNHIYLSENTNSSNVPIQISSRILFGQSNKDIFTRNSGADSNAATKLQSLLTQENNKNCINNNSSKLQSDPQQLIPKQQQDQLLLENYKTYNSKHLETSFSSYSNDEIYNISSCSVFNNNISKAPVLSDNPMKQQQFQSDQQYCSYGSSAQVFLEESQSKMVALENEISKLTDQNQRMQEEIEQLKQTQPQNPQCNCSNGTPGEINQDILMLQERLKQQDIVIAREQQKYFALSQNVQSAEQLFQQQKNESKRAEEMLRRQIEEITAEKNHYQVEFNTLKRENNNQFAGKNNQPESHQQSGQEQLQQQLTLNQSLKERIKELDEKVAELLESKYEQEQLVESYKKMTEESQKMNAESLGINETHINRIRELEQAIAASSSLVDKLAQKDVYIAQLIRNSENDKLVLQAETTSVLEEMKRLENNHSFELQLVRKKAEEEKQQTLEEINQLKIEIGTKADNFMQLQQLQALNQQLLEQLQLAETTNVQMSEQQEQEIQEKLSTKIAEQTYGLNSQLNNLKIAMRELETDNNTMKLQMDQQVTRFNSLAQQHTNAIAEKDQTISQLERQIHNLAQQSERTLQNFRAEKDREVAFVQREHQRMQLLLQEKMEVIAKINSIQANNPAMASQQLQLQQQGQGQLLQGNLQAPQLSQQQHQLYSQLQQQQYSQQQPFNSFDRQYPPPLPSASSNLLANNYPAYSKYRHPSLLDGQHANSILLRKNASLNNLSPSETPQSLDISHTINTTASHEERLNQTLKRPPLPMSGYMATQQQHLLHLSRQMPPEEPQSIQQTNRQMEGSALSQMKVTDPGRFDTSIVDENDVLNKMILERCKNIVEGIPNNNNNKINNNTNTTPNNKPAKSNNPLMN